MSRKRRRKKYQNDEQSENNNADAGASDDTAGGAAEEATEAEEAAEVVPAKESEAAVSSAPEQAERVEEAKTYKVEENGVTYQIQPRVLASGETRWTIVAFLPSVQGPVFQGERIPDDAADDLGLRRETQRMLNSAAAKANEQLGLPSSLRGEERERAPLSDLQENLED